MLMRFMLMKNIIYVYETKKLILTPTTQAAAPTVAPCAAKYTAEFCLNQGDVVSAIGTTKKAYTWQKCFDTCSDTPDCTHFKCYNSGTSHCDQCLLYKGDCSARMKDRMGDKVNIYKASECKGEYLLYLQFD